jgi:hypothetical protein
MAIHPVIIHTRISPLEDNIKAPHRVNRRKKSTSQSSKKQQQHITDSSNHEETGIEVRNMGHQHHTAHTSDEKRSRLGHKGWLSDLDSEP